MIDPLIDAMNDLVSGFVAAMHEVKADYLAPKNKFIKTRIMHPMVYNSDEEAIEHDLSTEFGRVMSMIGDFK
jgi:hypothetical protein